MQHLIESIRQAVIGEHHPIETPFGQKPLVYADYTASGRALDVIEQFIQYQVLPYYANTHTETSFTGRQTTALREQARHIIRQAVNGQEDDQIIFCGSGATAAIHKLIDILNLRLPADLDEQYQFSKQIPDDKRPVVFIGPYEHHSNELPWRESIAELVSIPLDDDGQIDLSALANALEQYAHRPLKIGSFSAASNVTGIKSDVDAITQLLHKHNTYSFWDYAAAAPYVAIDMTGEKNKDGDSSKDAVFISPHKFIGGPGTPGILIVKKHLLTNRVPAVPGGGTVVYVTPEDHRFIENPERREEGGTPAIVESIRAGLVFKLQQTIGTDTIEQREHQFVQQAIQRWQQHEAIEILGNPDASRLSIISLQIKWQEKYLHYGFVVALLNDLFGIQARGGCSCAGPYGHSLLGMDMSYSKALEAELLNDQMILRPGWVRLNFNYFIDQGTFDYLVRAIELIATHGWRLLPYYQFDCQSGVWLYQGQKPKLAVTLDSLDFTKTSSKQGQVYCPTTLKDCLATAETELTTPSKDAKQYAIELPPSAEKLRWFALPQDTTQQTIKD
ncbi:aminotransferase class V-fold PLP-dependent enzyme [Endozoicomonas sp. SM1973]|uniref:Aminotransferase class V-fold PLP-dependent enzyme n=1 Tax=Spartinivicinus marinus TaxID=2994442 RepID=A0A853IHL0_9GAMM|nr:aminotransferase class V-fold PLP-dependent enzyme [Spartinivicinus marinus]MCX4028386.1 aminotransferase class V-fold PLP-dependent enzyme [Spartinivicinus marinus]NYZ68615.1 aminotransferase class V-fold PLP-dependent enzyme [Spartinivicinus marinus]